MGHRSFGYATSPGAVREQNEDSLCVRPDIGLWAVADGMGGYNAGDIASRITVEQLAEDVGSHMTLSESISRIHHQILDVARTNSGCESMGSTVVALKTDGKNYEIAWVGDSRAYLSRGTQLTRLTHDHSYVQFLIDSGAIAESDAANHPERHAITQALGAEGIEEIEVETVHGSFYENDRILLCSDGLTNEVGEKEISSILAELFPEQTQVDRLIEAAIKNGGSDNISAILVGADNSQTKEPVDKHIEASSANSSGPDQKKGRHHFWLWMVILFLMLFISVVFVYGVL